jgi:S-formylglutathione hydrolase
VGTAPRLLAEHACFGGTQRFLAHDSRECATEMRFAVYEPPQARYGRVPVLYYLAGLTCTEETFMIKAGAQRLAAELGLMLVAPDTSPRSPRLPGDDADWDFGLGAGFYVDATRAPWSAHYRMYSYVTRELPALVAANFPARHDAQGIFGHSMGGHGALVCALRNPGQYRSLSAFAPISAPSSCPWGVKAFTGYLGEDRSAWIDYDTTSLLARATYPGRILVDQGLADRFLDTQLGLDALERAAHAAGQDLVVRRHEGYDHGYYFISTFVEDHLRHHAAALGAA